MPRKNNKQKVETTASKPPTTSATKKNEENTEEEKVTEQLDVLTIRAIKFDKTDEDYEQKKEDDVVLRDDFLSDTNIAFVTEWKGYPDKKEFSTELAEDMYSDMKTRRSMMELMQEKYLEEEENKEKEEKKQKSKKELTGEQAKYAAEWEEFKKMHGKKLTHISSITDITPLVAEFIDEHEIVVKVRVSQLTETFRRKVVNGRKFTKKHPVTWKDAFMFVHCNYDDLAEIYPNCKVYRIFGR